MRTKTKVLSALLGVLGTASLMAQSTNVYSLNAVGYINVTVVPGFNMVTCPLIGSPDNTVNSLLNNGSGVLNGSSVYFYQNGSYSEDSATTNAKFNNGHTNGWVSNGTNVLNPGVGFWFQNTGATNLTLTFVGTVPQGSLTNTLVAGFNLVGSAVPTSGDIISNTITTLTNFNIGDNVYVYNSSNATYAEYSTAAAGSKFGGFGYKGEWTSAGDPITSSPGQGFWYQNSGATVQWVENFSVNP